ncbi:MAG TPA: hypothetical protein VLF60_03980, partial [Candidatus Saccharimonadales bacterium]|nr:hypothetical protein [Candidatus Saccharimonadales bacterium]
PSRLPRAPKSNVGLAESQTVTLLLGNGSGRSVLRRIWRADQVVGPVEMEGGRGVGKKGGIRISLSVEPPFYVLQYP